MFGLTFGKTLQIPKAKKVKVLKLIYSFSFSLTYPKKKKGVKFTYSSNYQSINNVPKNFKGKMYKP